MSAVTWTDERIATLKKLWADGKTASEISAELGYVSRNGVIGKAHRLGLSSRKTEEGYSAPRPAKVKPLVGQAQFAKSKPDPKKVAEIKKIEARPAPANIPAPLLITLPQLTDKTCKWPVQNEKASTLFCGHNTEPGCPYCPGHKRMSIGRGTESERTALKVLRAVA